MLECISMSIAGAAVGLAYVLYRNWRREGIAIASRSSFGDRLKQGGHTVLIGTVGGFIVWGTGGATDIAGQAAVPARLVAALAAGAVGPSYVLSLIEKAQARELQESSARAVSELTAKTQASLEDVLQQLQVTVTPSSGEEAPGVVDTADHANN